MNEVSSMVDIISFGVPDTQPAETPRTNVPNFSSTAIPQEQSPPPQPPQSNFQVLSTIAPQPTRFTPQTGFGGLSDQHTPQSGFTPQRSGFQPVTTPNPGVSSQFQGVQPSGLSPQPTPLHAQPTGRPGQWGFVNAPAGSMTGIQSLQQRLMPQPGQEGGFSTTGLQGNANISWAITKEEKS